MRSLSTSDTLRHIRSPFIYSARCTELLTAVAQGLKSVSAI